MDSIKRQFVECGLRCTRQRIMLYEALCSTKSHPTADELFHMVSTDGDGHVSLATVYNALEAFSEVGLCRKLATTSGSVRYDADTSDHLHVRSRETGQIRDVPTELGRKLLENLPQSVIREIEAEMGVTIDGVQIQLIGESAAKNGR